MWCKRGVHSRHSIPQENNAFACDTFPAMRLCVISHFVSISLQFLILVDCVYLCLRFIIHLWSLPASPSILPACAPTIILAQLFKPPPVQFLKQTTFELMRAICPIPAFGPKISLT